MLSLFVVKENPKIRVYSRRSLVDNVERGLKTVRIAPGTNVSFEK